MAELDLTTYTGLKATVAKYLNRRDLDDQIPAFIRQHEAKMNRELRVRDMQTRSQATTSGEYIPLPGNFLSVYSLELGSPGNWGEPIRFVSEEECRRMRAGNPSGTRLQAYTLYGSEIELVYAPSEATDFRLKYHATIPALSASNATNWLLLKSPDLYVVGSCLEASIYLKNDERLQTWGAVRQQIIDAMVVESERALKPQGHLVATRRGF